MWRDMLADIGTDVTRFADRATVDRPPASITLNPTDWRAITDRLIRDPYTFSDKRPTVGTLWGMRVVVDPALPPGTWRLEHD